MAQFNPQMGAVSKGMRQPGWGQGLAIQAGIGSGLRSAQIREQRSQHEQTLAQNKLQFDMKMGWEKDKFNREQAFQNRQAKQGEKRAEKAERIGMFGTALEFGKLTFMMNEEAIVDDLGIGSGPAQTPGGKSPVGGMEVVPTSSQKAGDPSIDSQGETVRGTGTTTDKSMWNFDTFAENWKGFAAGAATGGMAGSMVGQAVFGKGKVQSAGGGAVGGAVGGYYGSGGSGYGAAGGALVGGILGYLLG